MSRRLLSPWSHIPAVLLPAFYAPPGPEPVLSVPSRRARAWDRLPAHLTPIETLRRIGGVPPVGEVRFSPPASEEP